MKTEDFEKMYAAVRPKAVRVAAKICGDAAEDAVQDAALWCLENLSGFDDIKESFFLQLVAKRATDLSRPRGIRVGAGRDPDAVSREISVGHTDELALLEKVRMPQRGRRVQPHRGADGQASPDTDSNRA